MKPKPRALARLQAELLGLRSIERDCQSMQASYEEEERTAYRRANEIACEIEARGGEPVELDPHGDWLVRAEKARKGVFPPVPR